MDCHFLLQGIFLTQGSNLCLLHWQADSLPLRQLLTSLVFMRYIGRFQYTLSQKSPASYLLHSLSELGIQDLEIDFMLIPNSFRSYRKSAFLKLSSQAFKLMLFFLLSQSSSFFLEENKKLLKHPAFHLESSENHK